MASPLKLHKHGSNFIGKKKKKKIEKKQTRKEKGKKKQGNTSEREREPSEPNSHKNRVKLVAPSEQAAWFTQTFHSSCGALLSALEQDPLPGDCFTQLSEEKGKDDESLAWHLQQIFGASWKKSLFEAGNDKEEKGSPALLILCSSATRCIELLKPLRQLTKACKPAKLFAKHIKLEEQVSALEGFINIAAGTPNRVKKLLDMGALALDRLFFLLLDMHVDAKGFTLFTLPQVKDEFWKLYKEYFHQRLLDKHMRLCLY